MELHVEPQTCGQVRGVALPRIQDTFRAAGLVSALRQGGLTQAGTRAGPRSVVKGRSTSLLQQGWGMASCLERQDSPKVRNILDCFAWRALNGKWQTESLGSRAIGF